FDMLGAGDRDDVLALRQHPGERQLRGRAALLLSHLLDFADERDVLLEILPLEARVIAAEIVLGEVVRRLELAGEEPAAERRISDIADAQLAHRGKHFGLRVAAPQRQLRLYGGDLVDLVRLADRLGRRFGKAEEADLPLLFQARHFAHRVLDRHLDIDAVLVIEVDRLDVQPLEARLARRAHIVGVAADAEELAVGPAYIAELRRQEHIVAPAVNRAAD